QGSAITHSDILFGQELEDYKKQQLEETHHYVEPIQIRKKTKGYLIVDLDSNQCIDSEGKEFIQTFASSLAIMLQNKLLFERFRTKHAELDAVLESMSEGLMLLNNQHQV